MAKGDFNEFHHGTERARCGRTIHEVLKQEACDKAFVASLVSGMDYLREAVKDTTPQWQESHTGFPAAELRAFVKEIDADGIKVEVWRAAGGSLSLAGQRADIAAVVSDDRPDVSVPVWLRSDVVRLADKIWNLADRG